MKILLSKLKVYCNPFEQTVWCGLENPIAVEEVQLAIEQNLLCSAHVNGNFDEYYDREKHVQRIAYFVVNGWEDRISIDVGAPMLGCHVGYFVQDGNHRLAAAIFRGDSFIEADVCGQRSYCCELFDVGYKDSDWC